MEIRYRGMLAVHQWYSSEHYDHLPSTFSQWYRNEGCLDFHYISVSKCSRFNWCVASVLTGEIWSYVNERITTHLASTSQCSRYSTLLSSSCTNSLLAYPLRMPLGSTSLPNPMCTAFRLNRFEVKYRLDASTLIWPENSLGFQQSNVPSGNLRSNLSDMRFMPSMTLSKASDPSPVTQTVCRRNDAFLCSLLKGEFGIWLRYIVGRLT